jgi:hypothetical protein
MSSHCQIGGNLAGIAFKCSIGAKRASLELDARTADPLRVLGHSIRAANFGGLLDWPFKRYEFLEARSRVAYAQSPDVPHRCCDEGQSDRIRVMFYTLPSGLRSGNARAPSRNGCRLVHDELVPDLT